MDGEFLVIILKESLLLPKSSKRTVGRREQKDGTL
nr:MAG TPA: hypothetical protein [Caudoviricetes sp.]